MKMSSHQVMNPVKMTKMTNTEVKPFKDYNDKGIHLVG